MDHVDLVYKVDYLVQSSLSSSLVLIEYKVLFIEMNSSLEKGTYSVGCLFEIFFKVSKLI